MPAVSGTKLWVFAAISVVFAVFGRAVRGVTSGGATAGAVVSFLLLCAAGFRGLAALLTVFVLTWACTRFGYARKQGLGTAEARTGRDASQVLANLGVAGLCGIVAILAGSPRWLIAMAAALSEAAADTVSSELGQAIGGTPVLITSWKAVMPGSNGAVTLVGSFAGILAASIVAAVCSYTREFGVRAGVIAAVAGIIGMLADSVLGATLENSGVIGNNLVNFVSTAIASTLAMLMAR